MITTFVDAKFANLSSDALANIEKWTVFEFGDFIVVRHLEDYAMFLDRESPPQVFGVNAVWIPFTEFWNEDAFGSWSRRQCCCRSKRHVPRLPRTPSPVSETVLLPFENRSVTDAWITFQQIVFGGNISTDIDAAYEETL